MPSPGVVLLTVDCMRPDRLGCYGRAGSVTPRLDAWARHAALFTHCWAHASWTTPALFSIFTGTHPCTHAVTARGGRWSALTEPAPLLFRKLGWHVPSVSYLAVEPTYAQLGYSHNGAVDRTASDLIECLRTLPDEPFFVWYHAYNLHLPYQVDADKMTPRLRPLCSQHVIPVGSLPLTTADRDAVLALYDAQLAAFDEVFASIVEALRARGRYHDTVLILTADHGDELLEHGWIGHSSTAERATLHEEVLRVPLVMSAPRWLGEGHVSHQPARHIDVLPTLLHIVAARGPENWLVNHPNNLDQPLPWLEGRSLWPALNGVTLPAVPIYAETSPAGFRTVPGDEVLRHRSLLSGGWKLIETPDGARLYDLRTDPGELHDRSASELGEVARLLAELDSVQTRWELPRRDVGTPDGYEVEYRWRPSGGRKFYRGLLYLEEPTPPPRWAEMVGELTWRLWPRGPA